MWQAATTVQMFFLREAYENVAHEHINNRIPNQTICKSNRQITLRYDAAVQDHSLHLVLVAGHKKDELIFNVASYFNNFSVQHSVELMARIFRQ